MVHDAKIVRTHDGGTKARITFDDPNHYDPNREPRFIAAFGGATASAGAEALCYRLQQTIDAMQDAQRVIRAEGRLQDIIWQTEARAEAQAEFDPCI